MKFSAETVKTTIDSPLGAIVLGATDAGLCGLWFRDEQRHLPDWHLWREAPAHPLLRRAADDTRAYFAGQPYPADLPLDLGSGTAFQQDVWRALLAIPWGGTTSYGAVSRQVGRPQAVRATGAAVGRNPLSLIVPCHRVVGSSGSLTGYAGGLHRKTALLQLEGVL